MNSPWSNTSHITTVDEADHEASMNLRRLQKRIHNLKRKRPEPEVNFKVETFHIGQDEDIVDVLHAMLDEGLEDEDD